MRYATVFLCSFLLAVTFVACDKASLFDENRDIKGDGWNIKDRLVFDFEVPDTVTKYNFYFNIRNTDEYQFSNIYVFMHTQFPNGKMGNDTIELPLMDETGHWLGKGQGDVHDCRLIFRQGVRFPLKGKYHIEVEQGMRMETLPGIINAGLRIERSEE